MVNAHIKNHDQIYFKVYDLYMMKILLLSIIAFSMIGLIFPSGFSEIYIHESDYPFSIQYPSGWEALDEDEWGGVYIVQDKTGRNGMYVGLYCSEIRDEDCGQAGADYQELNYLREDLEWSCENATFQEVYYRCSNLEFLDEYVHQLDGYRAITILETSTTTTNGKDPLFPEGKSGKFQAITLITYVLVGNDIWWIGIGNEADKFDQLEAEKILSTFKLNDIHSQVDIFEPPTWFESLINAIMGIFNWNTDHVTESIDKVPFEEADDFFNDPNIDWANPIIIEMDPCLDYEC